MGTPEVVGVGHRFTSSGTGRLQILGVHASKMIMQDWSQDGGAS